MCGQSILEALVQLDREYNIEEMVMVATKFSSLGISSSKLSDT
ncbi:MAG: hypothetical protein ACJA2S_001029 [Cyclobacteriaceae bacterium]|jgi:hypothetical protein